MAEYKAVVEPFQNKGLVTKLDPAALQPGQFQNLVNITSLQENSLAVVRGTQRINGANPLIGLVHTIQKLRKSASQAANYRYLGVGKTIWRGAATDAGPFTQIVDLGDPSDQVRWTSIDYATGVSGNPTKYIATNSFAIPALTTKRSGMLKDNGLMTPPQYWGINPPTRPVTAAQTTAGLLDVAGDGVTASWNAGMKFPSDIAGKTVIVDGVENTVAIFTDEETITLATAATPGSNLSYSIVPDGVVADFDWLYTFRNDVTGLEGNPCVPMEVGKPDDGSFYTLTFGGTDDPQITPVGGHHSIAIYRRGGIYSDGLYRFIGYAQNSSSFFLYTTFVDNVSDDSLVNARILEFDNDAPVTSNLQVPLSATINSSSATITGGNYYSVTLNTLMTPSGVGALDSFLTVGSPITVGKGDATETAYIAGLGTGNLTFVVWLQNAHSNGDPVECSNIVNAPCQFSCLAFNSAFLAGDANNPHVLYKSKTQRVESFPGTINLEDGASGNIVVGSPSNPIRNITEFNGQVVVLNLSNINLVNVWNGAMQPPLETPAKRGLLASFAWCKVGNSIWYLSYDGIYSWEGGQEQKRSEAINPMFLGEFVNGIPPMDMNAGNGLPTDPRNALQYVTFEYHNHEVNVIYRDTTGTQRRLRYSIIYDRWYIRDDGPGISEQGQACAVNAMHLDVDTGNLVLGKFINNGRTFIEYDDLGTSDSWFDQGQTDPGASGGPIFFDAYGAFYDLGEPAANKHFGDLVLELDNLNCTAPGISVQLFWDNATTGNAWDQYIIPSGFATVDMRAVTRRTVPLPILDQANRATGRDARVMAARITGSSVHAVYFYSLTFNVLPLELQQRGRAYDWDWLEYDYDKLLRVITFEYDLSQSGGGPRTLVMDTKTGINGTTTNLAVQSFTITSDRTKANFPIHHDTVAKMVRLRMLFDADETQSYMFWKYKFEYDKWPPDTVLATSWEPNGPDYDKYYQQVDLDVDTGGVSCTVQVQIDGATAQTLPKFATTSGQRHVNFTLNPNLKGKQARLLIDPDPGGKFQLFKHEFITLPADKGPVLHTYDWDDLGHPYDKRLTTVTFEYELMRPIGGTTVQIQMDTITGIHGSTINTNVQQFTLDGSGRSKYTPPINLDTVAKMVRLFPVSDTTVFKDWKYIFNKIDYPADIIAATEANDLGYPCEKILRELTLDMDTGGVPCLVGVEIDGRTQYTFSVTTTLNDKSRMITMPSRPNELIGKYFRLIFTPGPGGKAQYFKHDFSRIIEPCRVYHVSSFQQNAGSNGYKLLKRVWAEYTSYTSIIASIYTDNNQLFFQKVMPAHPSRDVFTFLVPAESNGVLNKSYLYTVDFDSCDTFKLYKDSCRIEIRNLAEGTRAEWRQFYLWQTMPLPGI